MNIAIIVTYNPDIDHVNEMIVNLKESGTEVIIFDNTPSVKHLYKEFENVDVIRFDGNFGLGFAFNKSIEFARSNYKDVSKFMFFDQDATFKSSDVISLFDEFDFLEKQGYEVGVLGASALMIDGKPYPFKEHIDVGDIAGYEQPWFVMSSFSVIKSSTFDKIGLFREELFIDLIDSEFSFRCRKSKLLNLVSKNTTFKHIVGESRKKIGSQSYSISKPTRNYYQVRNAIIVCKEYGWFFICLKTIFKRFTQTCLSGYYDKNLLKRLKFFFKGFMDGVNGKTGKIS